MSIIAEYRRCLKCGKIYSFNPDVGHFGCPNCGFWLGRSIPDLIIKKPK